MPSLNHEQFRDALAKGLGRARQHIAEYGDGEFRDELLYACTYDLTLNQQDEGSRAEWLLSIIDETGNLDFYQEKIIEAIADETDFWRLNQLLDFAVVFARRGSQESRKALYRKFDSLKVNETWLGGEHIIQVDGLEGFLHAAEAVGARLRNEQLFSEDDSLLQTATYHLDEHEVLTALAKAATKNENIKAYWVAVEEHRASVERRRGTTKKPEPIKLETILTWIESTKIQNPYQHRFFPAKFGREATDEDLQILYERLLIENERDKLLHYLRIFRRRAVPYLHERLFELAKLEDEDVQGACLDALRNTPDKRIRDLAIYLFQNQPRSICCGSIQLLNKNFQKGDYELIRPLLSHIVDKDELHAVNTDLRNLAKENFEERELAEGLMWCYEYNPCSKCRQYAVENLVKRKQIPKAILEECLWDCQKETRELAKTALEN